MKPVHPRILTINGSSSSIEFSLYSAGAPLERRLYGKVDRIDLSGTSLTFNGQRGNRQAGSYVYSVRQSPGHHDHLPCGRLAECSNGVAESAR